MAMSAEQLALALERGRRGVRLAAGVPRLRVVRLLESDPENAPAILAMEDGLNLDDRYVILGEVGASRHYLVLNLHTGQLVPGMLHLDRFTEVADDEL